MMSYPSASQPGRASAAASGVSQALRLALRRNDYRMAMDLISQLPSQDRLGQAFGGQAPAVQSPATALYGANTVHVMQISA